MADYEIEYLEEDEEYIHQYLQEPSPQQLSNRVPKKLRTSRPARNENLLVERTKITRTRTKRKHKQISDKEPFPEDTNTDNRPELENSKTTQRRSKRIKISTNKTPEETVTKVSGAKSKNTPVKNMPVKNTPAKNTPAKTKISERIRPADKVRAVSGQTLSDDGRNKARKDATLRNGAQSKARNGAQRRKESTPSDAKKTKSKEELESMHRTILKQMMTEEILKQKAFILNRAKKDPMRRLHDIRFADSNDPEYLCRNSTEDESKISTWNRAVKTFAETLNGWATQSCRTVQYLRKVQKLTDGKATNFIRLYHETNSNNKFSNFEVVLPNLNSRDPVQVDFEPYIVRKVHDRPVTTILTKETVKDGQILVAFNPTQLRVTTFEMVEREDAAEKEMRMLMTCQMCAKCYQYSWRGGKEHKSSSELKCIICSSTFPSTYNLLSHIRNHRLTEQDKARQNQLLAKIMPYHYNCRLCGLSVSSIPELRTHLRSHRSIEKFFCEVGRHITN